ncbi:diaminopropionate ammonia-lyase [Thalassomonas actiniarum]|uniref:Diaminopropionate ammonia-lyase n=1 Tax=Thalassomonas actiniarum TaxID=485447 RepID=A0AAE9YVU1_9GAMM|nr:diaminopropionate ammonia-lyase [Thalassomonas actiniarum]WDE01280.1 diaminopropionate ammonia-lyase [Thalassomonas actiniarum]
MFNCQQPKALLQACPFYRQSPLTELSYLGQNILFKDESKRMGLGSFKALGGFYALARLIALALEKQTGKAVAPEEYLSEKMLAMAKTMTFVCASAGNHGLAVAAGAKIFSARARIHLAETVPESFAARLRDKGAQVVRSGTNYEASMAAAIKDAEQTGAVHLGDGSWPGYTEIPRLVMEGYTVIAEEMRQAFQQQNNWPSHVFLQAGVGGLAAAITFMIRAHWQVQPKIIIVEPELAPCLQQSTDKGEICTVSGGVSNMGRLDCKTPSLLAFDILQHQADSFVTVSEQEAVNAAAIATDLGLATTTSGAAGLAALLKSRLVNSRSLVIITEQAASEVKATG